MEQYFLFKAGRSIPNNTFKELVNETYRERFELKFNDHLSGYIVADSRFYDALSLLLPVVNSDLGLSMTTVVVHRLDELAWASLDFAFKYKRQSCWHLGDLVFEAMFSGEDNIINHVKTQFKHVDHELMLTAQTFIDAGLNATSASKKLYIHRNTFNYRLQKFIEQTGLDIRDYHQAFYFFIAIKIIYM